MKVGVVLVCAGRGRRLRREEDKAFVNFINKPLFLYSYEIFIQLKDVSQLSLVLRKKYVSLVKRYVSDKKVRLVEGGKEREDSVYNGVLSLDESIDYVIIHDGARPFVRKEKVEELIRYLRRYDAVTLGIPLREAIKQVEKGVVKQSLERKNIYITQTPQGFRKDVLLEAYNKFGKGKGLRRGSRREVVDDETQFLERLGKKIKVIWGDVFNIKITYPQDLVLGEMIWQGGVKNFLG
ncbi:MAG: 2-C-methyl-D-erythritol 4-phosphate cytidylyltransferase [Candidatus Omnitrophica bacterium 4484_70.2]|nr:MAG: 2-C-methyl-D-erythritol 4-phosphate cytidylyltransferase [Candidatus Omnitrophica bacterium 4484_70.2]